MPNKQQYSINETIIGNYVVSYGVMQSVNDSCDLIDFFKISPTKYGFYLADLANSGKPPIKAMHNLEEIINKYGVPVSGFSLEKKDQVANVSDIKYAEKEITLANLEPAAIVKNINKEINSLQSNIYITITYGILDLTANKISYTTAGSYPNPILVSPSKATKYLLSKGYPLGLVKNASFSSLNVVIEVGGALVFFSDGILRFLMLSENKASKEEQLLNLVASGGFAINGIFKELNLTYNAPAVDDIVILIINRKS